MIVIGGSLGGCEAAQRVLSLLPTSFALPIALVLHRHKESGELLLPVMQQGSPLPVCEPEDKEPIRPGWVYLCPADYHLLIDGDVFSLSTDEPLNFARPSIDVLFDSAAEWKRRSAIAVVLTGSGSDGARGARRIQECGGTVLVQEPKSAAGWWMPAAAIAATAAPQVLSLEQIAQALVNLAGRRGSAGR